MSSSSNDLQQEYYARTARDYDDMHAVESDEHYFALRHIVFYLEWLGAQNVLDTGCGTGRALRYISGCLPNVRVHGNDPSEALLSVAVTEHGVSPDQLDVASSDRLPYPDASFDAVVETDVLHHVPDPAAVVAEMLRVSRLAVFISDSNIYGQGSLAARLAKLAFARARLLTPINRIRRGGRDWYYSEGDGVAYSYSVFDSQRQVAGDCEQVFVIPTIQRSRALSPRIGAEHALLCGFKKRLRGAPTPTTEVYEPSDTMRRT